MLQASAVRGGELAENSLDWNALTAQGFEMRSTDKTQPDNGGAKRVHRNTSTVSGLDAQSHLK